MAGLVLTKLSGWPARVAGTDLVVRRRAEAVLRELRNEIATLCLKMPISAASRRCINGDAACPTILLQI